MNPEKSNLNGEPEVPGTSGTGMFQGTLVVLSGMVVVLFLDFFSKIVLARNVTISNFGVYGIAASLSNIVIIICLAGIGDGVASKIAKARTNRLDYDVSALAGTSIAITLLLSIVGMVAMFASADFIAIIMSSSELGFSIKIMSLSIPILTVGRTLTGIKRGFKDYKRGTIFSDLSLMVTRTALFLVVAFSLVSLVSFLWAFVFSAIISTSLYLVDIQRQNGPLHLNSTTARTLTMFSLPLVAEPLLYAILTSAGAIFLAAFWNTEYAGLYSAANQFGVLVYFPIVGVVFLYLPIASELIAGKNLEGHNMLYNSVTKWASFLAANVLLLDLLFPQTLLELIGPGYSVAADWLRILAIGYILYVFFGPLTASVISIGLTKMVAVAWLVGTFVDFLLMITLVPSYAGTGAAVATGCGFFVVNLILASVLRNRLDLRILHGKQHRVILISLLLSVPFWWLFSEPLGGYPLTALPLLLLLVMIISSLALLSSRSITYDDLALIDIIEQTLGLHLGFVRKILSRFAVRSPCDSPES